MEATTYLTAIVVFVVCLSARCVSQDVRQPPRVRTPSVNEKRYEDPRTSFIIQCQADGIPTPTYEWQRNEMALPQNPKVTYNSVTGDLDFKEFDSTVAGEYMCIASNIFDNPTNQIKASAFSPPVTLYEKHAELFNVSQVPVQHQAAQYSYQTIKCNPNKIIARDYSIGWYIVTTDSDRRTIDTDSGRLYVDNEGTLHFTYVKLEDQTNGFSYQCDVYVEGLASSSLGNRNRMTVTLASSPSTIKPQLQYSNSGVKAMLYGQAELECVFSGFQVTGNSLPVIIWKDDTGAIITDSTKYALSNGNRKLTIKDLKEEDDKTYFCEASNSQGTSGQQPVALNVTSAPIFVKRLDDTTVPEGRDVDFYCQARSALGEEPPQTPVWYINGEKTGTHTNPTRFKFSESNTRLTIQKVSKANDILCVQCKVTNSEGSVWGNGCLNVILPITITNSPPPVQEVEYGDIVDLTVTAQSDPSVTLVFTWVFQNQTYLNPNAPPFVTYDSTTLQAYINTSKITEEEFDTIKGVYIRDVSNTHQTLQVKTEVLLKDRSDPIRVAGDGFHFWIIGLIIAIILLIIVIAIIIFICCRRQDSGEYDVDKKETNAGYEPEKELEQNRFDDYSRPDYDEMDYKPPPSSNKDLEYDDFPARSDDDESLDNYDKDDSNFFNEDGSFIGQYNSKKGQYRGGQQMIDNPGFDTSTV